VRPAAIAGSLLILDYGAIALQDSRACLGKAAEKTVTPIVKIAIVGDCLGRFETKLSQEDGPRHRSFFSLNLIVTESIIFLNSLESDEETDDATSLSHYKYVVFKTRAAVLRCFIKSYVRSRACFAQEFVAIS